MQGLTSRQAELLAYLRVRDPSPSFDEIARALGWAKSSVHRRIVQLEARGFIEWLPNTARSIRVLETPRPPRPPRAHGLTSDELATELRLRGWTLRPPSGPAQRAGRR